MFHLACTRFNHNTYAENMNYRHKNNINAIYGSTLKIRGIYSQGCLMFIAEMNNQTNEIEGIGLIQNLLVCNKSHNIYENSEYNRYIYKGKYWLSRSQINELNPQILEIFDNILFKKKSHLKCRIGITIITEKIFAHWDYELQLLKNMVKKLFLDYFKNNIDDEFENEEKEENRKNEENEERQALEHFEIIPKKRKKERKRNEKGTKKIITNE